MRAPGTDATDPEVGIAGSFNDWHPNVTPMIRLNDGKWAKELALPPGRYEYRFVVVFLGGCWCVTCAFNSVGPWALTLNSPPGPTPKSGGAPDPTP